MLSSSDFAALGSEFNIMSSPGRYPANIFYSEEDEGFVATAPDLPGCSAFGETQEEVLTELQHAIRAWIAAANAAGNPIPAPSPLKNQPKPSGKILIRIPRGMHANLIDGAKREGTSLNQYILSLLAIASTCDAMGIYDPQNIVQARSAVRVTGTPAEIFNVVAVSGETFLQGTVPTYVSTASFLGWPRLLNAWQSDDETVIEAPGQAFLQTRQSNG
jgi:antitoxin HicB